MLGSVKHISCCILIVTNDDDTTEEECCVVGSKVSRVNLGNSIVNTKAFMKMMPLEK